MKNIHKINDNIYITSDEEIKEGDWVLMFDDLGNLFLCDKPQQYLGIEKGHYLNKDLRKIILTTDQDLIKDGVQVIDDEFLQWFVQNPSCEEVEVVGDDCYYEIIIPKEEPKQIKCYCGHTIMCDCSPKDEPKDVVLGYKTSLDAQMLDRIEPKQEEIDFYAKELMLEKERAYKQETLEEAAERIAMTKDWDFESSEGNGYYDYVEGFTEGAKWQQERMYSEEEVRNLFRNYQYDSAQFAAIMEGDTDGKPTPTGWFEKFKKK